MVLDKKKRKLSYGLFIKKEYHLRPQEIRLLEAMNDKELHSIEELIMTSGIKGEGNIRYLLSELREKNIQIYNEWGVGYKLDSDIRIIK